MPQKEKVILKAVERKSHIKGPRRKKVIIKDTERKVIINATERKKKVILNAIERKSGAYVLSGGPLKKTTQKLK